MGAYLSEPVTEKISSDADGEYVRYGASSMQGWRVSQEDAHNCLIDFDEKTSLFAVYDGHGGHEVALYCSQKLPDFIKNTEAYSKDDYKNALIEAFLSFDATIASRDVVAVLKELAGSKDNEHAPTDGSSDDEENVSNLFEEASMPIEQVIEKYQSSVNSNFKKLQNEKLPPNSPFLRARKSVDSHSASCSGAASSSGACSTSVDGTNVVSSTNSDDSNGETITASSTDQKNITFKTESNTDKNDVHSSPDSSKEEPVVKPDSSKEDSVVEKPVPKIELNGEVTESSKDENECTSTTTRENGDIKVSPKGKGKAIMKKTPKVEGSTRSKSLRIRNTRQLYNKLLDLEDDSESDENDETFEGTASNSSSEAEDAAESSEGVDDDEEEDEEEDEEDEDVMEEDDDDDNEFTRNITEEPGSDSGCTAVVALLRGNELFVANAGDSRCIVCRKGQAIEMSFDHKPEDEPEMARIIKAGGKVTQDGRVNGGLNLSRAIGDHAYKQNKELSDREQMITALPDIRVLTINPAEDEFMVLACDGIWNFMSSQEVVDFVRPRLQEKTKISQICEEIFDHCLAPNTMGDGTGCDNMTAVIVQFQSQSQTLQSNKRCASPITDENATKKPKTEEM